MDLQVTSIRAPRSLDNAQFVAATLNVAHGRGRSFHQAFQTTSAQVKNIGILANALRQTHVDFVALQEVDRDAWWTGNVNQVEMLATNASFDSFVSGDLVSGMGLNYGTALLVKGHLSKAQVEVFPAGAFTPAKGFTVARWQLDPQRVATVVSVHLHFLSGDRQRKQARTLVRVLKELPGPYIICGDFNAGWDAGEGIITEIAENLNLTAWRPTSNAPTLVGSSRRIDWILISDPLVFIDYNQNNDIPSDHALVYARIEWPLR